LGRRRISGIAEESHGEAVSGFGDYDLVMGWFGCFGEAMGKGHGFYGFGLAEEVVLFGYKGLGFCELQIHGEWEFWVPTGLWLLLCGLMMV
jgi:hypothetical protein